MCTGINRLNGIIQKLIQRGNPPTDEAKSTKLKEALDIPSSNQLWLTISLRSNLTCAEIVPTSKRYDKATEQQRVNSVIGEADPVSEEVIVCSYCKSRKEGYTGALCWLRKRSRKRRSWSRQDGAETSRGTPVSLQRISNHVRRLVGLAHAMRVAPRHRAF